MSARRWPTSIAVGVVAFVLSLGRLWLGNHDALTQVVWAEDGLFPLCVRKTGFITCLVDPFAGYLLALPPSTWALATNLAAGLLAGLAGAFGYLIVRRAGLGPVVSVTVGLLPVIVPVVGLEAINALGSSYMLLLYVSTLLVAFPGRSRLSTALVVAGGALLLLTALTIPTAVVVGLAVVVQAARGALPRRAWVTWLVAIGLGLVAQAWTATHAAIPRAMHPGVDTVRAWIDGIPATALTYVPGLELHDYTFGLVFPITPSMGIGVLCAAALAITGVVVLVRGWRNDDRRVAIGILLLSGLALGAVPADEVVPTASTSVGTTEKTPPPQGVLCAIV